MSLKRDAEEFLKWFGKKTVYTWGRFYFNDRGRYWEITEHDLNALIGKYFHAKTDTEFKERDLGDVAANLKPRCLWIHNETPPCWIESAGAEGDVIPMRNGLLRLDLAVDNPGKALLEHDHRYFTFVALPYEFVANAQCPIWSKFLNEVLPNGDERNFLQEWIGYHFAPHRYYQRVLLLYGQGANGKTVVCVVLKEVLGAQNFSSVSLEQFDPKRTFVLAATIGKLGNVVGELSPASKAAEGLIKQYISGEVITIEEKYKPAMNVRPTAHLTFATNELPSVADRSDGMWRRLIILPFNKQILDESLQDKRLVDPLFWRNSGELPGIFRWALEGRKRLLERGYFIEPVSATALKEDYRGEMNSALTFLRSYRECPPSNTIPSHTLYGDYKAFAWSEGQQPLTAAQFAQEVRRQFPGARLSRNPIHIGGGQRSRVWYGVARRPDTAGTDGTR